MNAKLGSVQTIYYHYERTLSVFRLSVSPFLLLPSLNSSSRPDPKGDPLHVSPDGVHRPFKPVKEILASRPVRGCLSPLGARQEVPERPESPSSLQFRNDTESGDGTNKSQKKRISFVDEGTVLNSGSHVGQGNVLCLLDPKDQEVNVHVWVLSNLYVWMEKWRTKMRAALPCAGEK